MVSFISPIRASVAISTVVSSTSKCIATKYADKTLSRGRHLNFCAINAPGSIEVRSWGECFWEILVFTGTITTAFIKIEAPLPRSDGSNIRCFEDYAHDEVECKAGDPLLISGGPHFSTIRLTYWSRASYVKASAEQDAYHDMSPPAAFMFIFVATNLLDDDIILDRKRTKGLCAPMTVTKNYCFADDHIIKRYGRHYTLRVKSNWYHLHGKFSRPVEWHQDELHLRAPKLIREVYQKGGIEAVKKLLRLTDDVRFEKGFETKTRIYPSKRRA